MADSQRDAVVVWSKERARVLCHRASAFGTTSDYEYAEAVPSLVEEFAETFPGVPLGLIQSVRYALRLFNSPDMDLAEVNRLRAEKDLPPLTQPGPIEHWPKFTPPMPFNYDRFMSWVAARASELRHRAAALGEPAEYAYLRQYPVLLASFQQEFPGCTSSLVDSSEILLYGEHVELRLEEINRVRTHHVLPPLDFIPTVSERVMIVAPAPRRDSTPLPPGQ